MSIINIMALRHSAFYSPLLMTMAGGFLKKQGLDYNYTLATPENSITDNINKGTCHLAQSAVATSFSSLEAGDETDIVHFAQINSRDGFFIAARDRDDNFTWDKLIGKEVLVDHFFQPYAMLKYGLYKQGINIDDINVIDAGNVEQIDSAFRRGQGDYVHQQGPLPQQLNHDGLGYVVGSVGELVGPVAFSSLCASREWLNSDMAGAFMSAYQESLKYVIDAPAEEIAVREFEAGFFPDIDINVLAETIVAYKRLGCWQVDPNISRQAYENLQDVFLYSGLISRKYDYDKVIISQ